MRLPIDPAHSFRATVTTKVTMFRTISLCLLGALLLVGADAPQKSAFDKPTMEAYVRHL